MHQQIAKYFWKGNNMTMVTEAGISVAVLAMEQ